MTRARGGSGRVRPAPRSNSIQRPGLALVAVLCLLVTPGCFTMEHTVGAGPIHGNVAEQTQWFAGWGVLPMDPVDSRSLAEGALDYRVTTGFRVADVLISMVTSFVGFYRQTIVVES